MALTDLPRTKTDPTVGRIVHLYVPSQSKRILPAIVVAVRPQDGELHPRVDLQAFGLAAAAARSFSNAPLFDPLDATARADMPNEKVKYWVEWPPPLEEQTRLAQFITTGTDIRARMYEQPEKVGWKGWLENKNGEALGFIDLDGKVHWPSEFGLTQPLPPTNEKAAQTD